MSCTLCQLIISLPLELQYRRQYKGDCADEYINKFIYTNREAMYAGIEVVRTRLFLSPISDATYKQILSNQ